MSPVTVSADSRSLAPGTPREAWPEIRPRQWPPDRCPRCAALDDMAEHRLIDLVAGELRIADGFADRLEHRCGVDQRDAGAAAAEVQQRHHTVRARPGLVCSAVSEATASETSLAGIPLGASVGLARIALPGPTASTFPSTRVRRSRSAATVGHRRRRSSPAARRPVAGRRDAKSRRRPPAGQGRRPAPRIRSARCRRCALKARRLPARHDRTGSAPNAVSPVDYRLGPRPGWSSRSTTPTVAHNGPHDSGQTTPIQLDTPVFGKHGYRLQPTA